MQQLFLEKGGSRGLTDAGLPSSLRHPASGFQAVFFAKPASMPVYAAKPYGSAAPQKSFESRRIEVSLLFKKINKL